jgi:hypothetical protein
MIIDDFHFPRSSVFPLKTDPPLIVDPNAVLSLAFTGQRFETVAAPLAQLRLAGNPDAIRVTLLKSESLIRDFRYYNRLHLLDGTRRRSSSRKLNSIVT